MSEDIRNLSKRQLIHEILHSRNRSVYCAEAVRRGGVDYLDPVAGSTSVADNWFAEWLIAIQASGWQGEGMHSPDKIVHEIEYAIQLNQLWDDLLDKAKDKYASVGYHQGIWAIANKVPLISLPEPIKARQKKSAA